jgi:hypothetical protein
MGSHPLFGWIPDSRPSISEPRSAFFMLKIVRSKEVYERDKSGQDYDQSE